MVSPRQASVTSFASSVSDVKGTHGRNSVEIPSSTPEPARRNSAVQSAWSDIKYYAREHHRAVNGAFEALYGNGVARYGANGESMSDLYKAYAINKKA